MYVYDNIYINNILKKPIAEQDSNLYQIVIARKAYLNEFQ